MKTFDLERIKDPMAREIVKALMSERVIVNHIINYSWMSGCCTEVQPIMITRQNVEIFLDSDVEKHFAKAIGRMLGKYPNIFKDGYFVRSDGSCPSSIRFNF